MGRHVAEYRLQSRIKVLRDPNFNSIARAKVSSATALRVKPARRRES
jgi:hypothetical protein